MAQVNFGVMADVHDIIVNAVAEACRLQGVEFTGCKAFTMVLGPGGWDATAKLFRREGEKKPRTVVAVKVGGRDSRLPCAGTILRAKYHGQEIGAVEGGNGLFTGWVDNVAIADENGKPLEFKTVSGLGGHVTGKACNGYALFHLLAPVQAQAVEASIESVREALTHTIGEEQDQETVIHVDEAINLPPYDGQEAETAAVEPEEAPVVVRELWSVWKDADRSWKVQFPKGIETFLTKKAAEANAAANRELAAKAVAEVEPEVEAPAPVATATPAVEITAADLPVFRALGDLLTEERGSVRTRDDVAQVLGIKAKKAGAVLARLTGLVVEVNDGFGLEVEGWERYDAIVAAEQ
jgi:hypothetical protein